MLDTPLTMKDIHIRDPFILPYQGIYYMYGTRADCFGCGTGGFDVYKSTDLVNWSLPIEVFDSKKYNLNLEVNWAPEVHFYNGSFYMFATHTFSSDGRRGTYIHSSSAPDGEFTPHSDGPVTPGEWYSLDGTFYCEDNIPYLVFCHEHVQIADGTIECVRLSDDLKHPIGECRTLFKGSDAYMVNKNRERFVTDGPFMFRNKRNELIMLWSTVDNGYLQCLAASDNGRIDGNFVQRPHLFSDDGGHGMLFYDFEGRLWLSLHSPNNQPNERPCLICLDQKEI